MILTPIQKVLLLVVILCLVHELAPHGALPPAPTPDAPAVGGLKVQIVHKESEDATLPTAQTDIYTADALRQYAKTHCSKHDDTADFRVTDVDAPLDGELPIFVKMMEKAKAGGKLPWIVITNGISGGFSGPLPTDVSSTLTLLQKYGGK